MPRTFTPRIGLQTPTPGDAGWEGALDANRQWLDGSFVGDFAVRPVNLNTTTGLADDRLYRIAGGSYRNPASDFAIAANRIGIAGSGDLTAAASATTSVYLQADGTFAASTSGFPAGARHLPLATITTNVAWIVTIKDERNPAQFLGGNDAAYVSHAFAGSPDDGIDLVAGRRLFMTADTAAGPVDVPLPAATVGLLNATVVLKKTTGDANAVTLTAAGPDTIDGGPAASTSAPYGVIRLVCGGEGRWWTM